MIFDLLYVVAILKKIFYKDIIGVVVMKGFIIQNFGGGAL